MGLHQEALFRHAELPLERWVFLLVQRSRFHFQNQASKEVQVLDQTQVILVRPNTTLAGCKTIEGGLQVTLSAQRTQEEHGVAQIVSSIGSLPTQFQQKPTTARNEMPQPTGAQFVVPMGNGKTGQGNIRASREDAHNTTGEMIQYLNTNRVTAPAVDATSSGSSPLQALLDTIKSQVEAGQQPEPAAAVVDVIHSMTTHFPHALLQQLLEAKELQPYVLQGSTTQQPAVMHSAVDSVSIEVATVA
jgi:hypothetical protein